MRIRFPEGVPLIGHERGATAVEYALMVSLIALAVIASVRVLGLALPEIFQSVADGLP